MGIFDWLYRKREKNVQENHFEKMLNNKDVEALINALNDTGYYASRQAAKALGDIGDPRAVTPLINLLKGSDYYKRNTHYIAHALIQIGKPAVGPLIESFNEITRFAIEILGQIGDQRGIEPLVNVLKNKKYSWYWRSASAEALDKIGWQPQNTKEKVCYCVAKEDWDQCVTYGEAAVEMLIADLDRLGSPNHPGPEYSTLVKIGNPAVKPLINFLKQECKRTKLSEKLELAVQALGEIGDPYAIEPLINAFTNRDGTLYYNTLVVAALGKFGDKKAIEPLVNLLSSDDIDNEQIRRSQAYIMRNIVENLEKLGWEPNTNEAGASYWAVKQRIDKCTQLGSAAVKPLIRLLRFECGKEGEIVAHNTFPAIALGEIGDFRAIEPLISALNVHYWQEGRPLQKAAAEALNKITGKNFGDNYDHWKKWWKEEHVINDREKLKEKTDAGN